MEAFAKLGRAEEMAIEVGGNLRKVRLNAALMERLMAVEERFPDRQENDKTKQAFAIAMARAVFGDDILEEIPAHELGVALTAAGEVVKRLAPAKNAEAPRGE